MPAFMFMEAEDCAELAVEACERNKAVIITGGVNKFLALLNRALPGPVAQKTHGPKLPPREAAMMMADSRLYVALDLPSVDLAQDIGRPYRGCRCEL